MNKDSLRTLISKQRNALSTQQQHTLSKKICEHLTSLEQIKQAHTVAIYFPYKNEADVTELMKLNKITWVFPVVLPNKHLVFYPYNKAEKTVLNKYGIPEPETKQAAKSLAEIDVIVLPALAFDLHCNRVGTGAGYYDRTLESFKKNGNHKHPFLIVAAYEFQKAEMITPDPWDIPADCAITEKQIYYRGNK